MKTTEWALILFTVLGQAAIGAFLLLTVLRQLNRDAARESVFRKSAVVLTVVAAVALGASLFHLGRPLMALNALRNLGSSWLSREIFFTGGFFVLLLAGVLLSSRPSMRRIIDWAACLAGVLSIVSMAASYGATMKPAWQGFDTYVAFAGTALFLGAALAAGLLVLFAAKGQSAPARELQLLVWVAVGAIVVQLIALPFYLVSLAGGEPAAQQSAALLAGKYGIALVLRWALALVGGLVPLLVLGRKAVAGKVPGALVYAALLFIVSGEVVGRFLFYATGISIGIGL